MRIPQSAITPALKTEIALVHQGLHTAATTLPASTEEGRLHRASTAAYYKARTFAITAWILYGILAFVGLITYLVAHKQGLTSLSLPAFWTLAAAYLGAALPLHRLLPSTKGHTPEEIAAYLPIMTLSPPERIYAEALVAAYTEGADPVVQSEILPALRSLCEESARLDAVEAQLADVGPVGSELEGLRARLAATEDPIAKDALATSLALAESRAAASLSERGAHERVTAHREMIRQSALTIAETVRRSRAGLDATSREAPDLATLRATVARATGDVAALEAAVQEMRAL